MRLFLPFLALALLVVPGCGSAPTSGPSGNAQTPARFTSVEGNFSIEMPGNPTPSRQAFQTPAGSITLNAYMVEDPDKTTYLANYSDYPAEFTQQNRPEQMLDGALRGLRSGPGWSVSEPTRTNINEHPAYEVRVSVRPKDGNEEGVGLVRLYLVGNRLYQIMVIGQPSKLNSPRMQEFVGSFALLNDVPPSASTVAGAEPPRPAPKAEPSRPAPEAKKESGPPPVAAVPGTTDHPAHPVPPPADHPTVAVAPKATDSPAAPTPPKSDDPMVVEEPSASDSTSSPTPPADRSASPTPPPAHSPGKASIVSFQWLDEDQDVVGGYGDSTKPDGTRDQHFRVVLDLPDHSMIEAVTITSGGFHKWVTKPTPGKWPIAVFHDGRPLNRTHVERVGEFSGRQTFDLYFNTGLGIGSGTEFELVVDLHIEGRARQLDARVKRPTAESAASTGGSAAPSSSSGGASIVSFQWLDEDQDVVGGHGDASKPDGTKDQHFKLDLNLPPVTTVEAITIFIDEHNRWVTRPTPGKWPVAVFWGKEAVSRTHVEKVGTYSGKLSFDLYMNTGGPIGPGTEFKLMVEVTIGGKSHTLRSQCRRPQEGR